MAEAAAMVQADLCCTPNRPRRAGDGGRAHGGGRASAEAAGVHKAQAATAVVVAVEVLNTS
mgnify:FL=1|jgi:hypothetical protein